MSGIRVRFAPSPTGPLHIGGARSALFNWLYARRYGGTFIVRIEDTDLVRSSRESEENILAALRWLGLDWDEGIGVGGLSGPYRQTERLELYGQIIDELLRGGQAYYCYCSEEELAKEKEKQLARGEAVPMYSGRCRCLTHEQRLEKEARGLKPVIRFKVPQDKTVLVSDQVRGEVSFDCLGIGDFIIVKSDGIPTYNFAVVVDDYHMQVSHVIRAEEHLSNTPRQVLIYQALGWSVPHFAHVSLILGSDRSKMSKRHGATAIEQYQEQGYLPEALVNFLALLGWSPEGENELLTPEQIVEQFSLDRVAKNPAVFDVDKLNWINGHYIRQSPTERITELALPFLRQAGYVGEEVTQEQYQWLKLLVYTVKDYLTTVADINSHVSIFFSEDIELDSQESREILSQQEVPRVLSAVRQKIEDAGTLDEATVKVILKGLAKELGLAGKKVFMPLRVALTGKAHGPELHLVIPVLGRDKTIKRLIIAQRDK